MNYGFPYKGSKNTIAEQVVDLLPKCDRFLDGCCGGGAVTQAAFMSGKFKTINANDIEPSVVMLLEAVMLRFGEVRYEEKQVTTRDDFLESLRRIKEGRFTVDDCVNRFCYSFGYNGRDYLWSKEKEELKYTVTQMLVAPTVHERRMKYREFLGKLKAKFLVDAMGTKHIVVPDKEWTALGQIENLQTMDRLNEVETAMRNCTSKTKISVSCGSIFDIDYSQYDMVYFDIPYKDTNKYATEFDHERFYELFASLKIPAFLSEYKAPFKRIASFKKQNNMAAKCSYTTMDEGLYFNGTLCQYEHLMGAPK